MNGLPIVDIGFIMLKGCDTKHECIRGLAHRNRHIGGVAFQQGLKMVLRLEAEAEQFGCQRKPPMPYPVKDILKGMGDARSFGIAEHRPASLERVHRPEDTGHQCPVVRSLFQFEEQRLHVDEQLACLIPEEAHHGRAVYHAVISCPADSA